MNQVLYYVNYYGEVVFILDDQKGECVYFLNTNTKNIDHYISEVKNAFYEMLEVLADDCADYDEISFVGADADYYSQIIKEFIENERENGSDYFDYLYKKLFQ